MMLSSLIAPVPLPNDVIDIDVTGLTADSRAVRPGMLFAALKGTLSNGQDYIPQAIKNGAVAILSEPGLGEISVPYIAKNNPREAYAIMAAQLYAGQPDLMVAVTGTNGKSSTIEFLRQIWDRAGRNAACFGTLGIVSKSGKAPLTHTTPDAVALQRTLHDLAKDGVTHCGMEASSHGLDQYRLEGVRLGAVGFTNLTQDHLDYHEDMEAYFQAKARLFTELAPKSSPAVINVDSNYGKRLAQICQSRGMSVMTIGWAGEFLRILEITPHSHGQRVSFSLRGRHHEADLPLLGEYQALNVIGALALAIVTGVSDDVAMSAIGSLSGVDGRMETVGLSANGAPVIVDFAHTPDGVEKLLKGIRMHIAGRIIAVFGCGGDRDPDKRSKMGKIAHKFADVSIVTDDNPRSEAPASIRKAVMSGCPNALEIGDRAQAIAHGISLLQKGDCLVIAGKGHESGQIIGGAVIPFKDSDVARAALSQNSTPLWSSADAALATGGTAIGTWAVNGLSIDTRTIGEGDLFIPLKDQRDGHDFIPMALEKGAIVMSERDVSDVPALLVGDSLKALRAMAIAARKRCAAPRIAVTGSVGKTSVKEALAAALSVSAKTHKSLKSFNNHWGVPLTMALMPQNAEYGVFETGMNHAGELSDLSNLLAPNIAIITKIAAAHLEHFENIEAIAAAKAEVFDGMAAGDIAILPADDAFFDFLSQRAKAKGLRVIGVGAADVDSNLKLQMQGAHHHMNAAIVMAAVNALGADINSARRGLEAMAPLAGRGEVFAAKLGGKTIQVIDESYNANPESMRAALAAFGQVKSTHKIAVLGDMLELGAEERALHTDLKAAINDNAIDRVITVGPRMQALYDVLPEQNRVNHLKSSNEIIQTLEKEIKSDSAVFFKASNSVGLTAVVHHLKLTNRTS